MSLSTRTTRLDEACMHASTLSAPNRLARACLSLIALVACDGDRREAVAELDVAADSSTDISSPGDARDAATTEAHETLQGEPDATADTAPETTVETTPDTAVDSAPEVAVDTTPDTIVDMTPDTGVDSASDTGADSLEDTAAEVIPDSDTAAANDTVDNSADGGCRTFDCACETNSDCDDGLCIEGLDGHICTRACTGACPSNFDCLTVTTFGVPQDICVPRHSRLCRPCRANAECDDPSDPYPAYCLGDLDAEPPGASGSFCGTSCATRACPNGFSCVNAPLATGGTAKQCVPSIGECACRPSWADLGYSTTCAVTNDAGSCDGTRNCTPLGLSACSAEVPTQELCDGEDNDCDGEVDNLGARACLTQNTFGQCRGTLACDGAAQTCVGPTPRAEFCNGADDDCDDQVDEAACDDGLTCTNDTCVNARDCTHAITSNRCLINGVCFAASDRNPLNACDVCDPARAFGAFSLADNSCIINGSCYPANAQNPDNACQICAPSLSTAQWSQAANSCDIQGECVAAGARNPNNACVVCDPSRNARGWSNAPSVVACDDANACSEASFCDGAGSCRGDTTCDDGDACSVDSCEPRWGCDNSQVTPGLCRIDGECVADGTAAPNNPCLRCSASINQYGWAPQPVTVACNDSKHCTTDDHCDGGGACIGTARSCGDGLDCTTDSCNEALDRCDQALLPSRCLIGNQCWAAQALRPDNGCYRCDPSAATTAWSLADGASCSDADICSDGDVCGGGVCSGVVKVDSKEPNAAGSPLDLGTVGDSETWSAARSFTATLFPANDEDWFSVNYPDSQTIGSGEPVPRVRMTPPSTQNYDLCAYFVCTGGGQPTINCGTDTASTFNNMKGCCSSELGSVADDVIFEPDCSGFNDSGRLHIVVRSAGGYDCADYNLMYGDDGD